MSFKELVKKEHQEMKIRIQEETSGMYVLWYIFTGICVLLMTMFGFDDYSNDDLYLIVMISLMIFCCMNWWGDFLKYVKENNKRRNIFIKYKFIPVSINKLICAKMVVFSKYVTIPLIVGQLGAIAIKICNPDNVEVRSFTFNFIPLYIGVILFIYEFVTMKILARLSH